MALGAGEGRHSLSLTPGLISAEAEVRESSAPRLVMRPRSVQQGSNNASRVGFSR